MSQPPHGLHITSLPVLVTTPPVGRGGPWAPDNVRAVVDGGVDRLLLADVAVVKHYLGDDELEAEEAVRDVKQLEAARRASKLDKLPADTRKKR